MKSRILSCFLIFALCISTLSACGSDTAPSDHSPSSSLQVEISDLQDSTPGETEERDGFESLDSASCKGDTVPSQSDAPSASQGQQTESSAPTEITTASSFSLSDVPAYSGKAYLNYLADADDSVDLSIQVTRSPDEFSSSVKIDDDIYIWTGTATQYKVNLLRKFFEQYKQDPSDLVFFLDDSRGIGSDEEIERYKIRRKYWESVLPSLQEATGTFLNISPSKNNSIMGATARSGVYLCCVANYDSAGVEIFIDQGDYQKNRAIYNHLEQNRDAIEAAYGKSLHWICQDDVRACKVYDEIKEVSIKNEEDWPVMSAFHIQRAKALFAATKQFLG